MQKFQLINISKKYLDGNKVTTILENINLCFSSAGFTGIIGDSGSGKSTILNLIGGLEKPSSGKILLDSQKPIYHCNFVLQNLNLLEHLKVKEHFDILNIKKESLNIFDLSEKINAYPSELSRGEKQRIAIILAIKSNKSIILADEPTSALDIDNSIKVMEELKKASESKLVIVVSHNLKLIKKYADTIYEIKDKKIVVKKQKKLDKMVILDLKPSKMNFIFMLKYVFKLLKFNYLKNLIVLGIVFLSIIGPFICQNAKISLTHIISKEKNESLVVNKFYLQVCEENRNGSLVMSDCRNPQQNEIQTLFNSDDFVVKENFDYMLSLLFNDSNLQTYKNNLNLIAGREPNNFYEVVTDESYCIGEQIELNINYLFSIGLLSDFINEKVFLTVVGNINKSLFIKENFIYFDYDHVDLYLKERNLFNISQAYDKPTTVLDYFDANNINNHKYVMFFLNIENIENILQSNNLTFEQENKVQLLSPTYNYYMIITDLINQSKKVLDITFIFNFVALLYFFNTIISLNTTKRFKEIGVLKLNNFSNIKINTLLLLENCFLTLFGVSLVLLMYYIFAFIFNKIIGFKLILFHLGGFIFLFLFVIVLILFFYLININKTNKINVVDILREEM